MPVSIPANNLNNADVGASAAPLVSNSHPQQQQQQNFHSSRPIHNPRSRSPHFARRNSSGSTSSDDSNSSSGLSGHHRQARSVSNSDLSDVLPGGIASTQPPQVMQLGAHSDAQRLYDLRAQFGLSPVSTMSPSQQFTAGLGHSLSPVYENMNLLAKDAPPSVIQALNQMNAELNALHSVLNEPTILSGDNDTPGKRQELQELVNLTANDIQKRIQKLIPEKNQFAQLKHEQEQAAIAILRQEAESFQAVIKASAHLSRDLRDIRL